MTDFGASCFHSDDDQLVELSYTEAWKAPEVRADNTVFTLRLAKKTDVYSFGKLCDWLVSQSDDDQTRSALNESRSNTLKSFLEFVEQGRDEDPGLRPDMYEFRKFLSGAIERHRKQK